MRARAGPSSSSSIVTRLPDSLMRPHTGSSSNPASFSVRLPDGLHASPPVQATQQAHSRESIRLHATRHPPARAAAHGCSAGRAQDAWLPLCGKPLLSCLDEKKLASACFRQSQLPLVQHSGPFWLTPALVLPPAALPWWALPHCCSWQQLLCLIVELQHAGPLIQDTRA